MGKRADIAVSADSPDRLGALLLHRADSGVARCLLPLLHGRIAGANSSESRAFSRHRRVLVVPSGDSVSRVRLSHLERPPVLHVHERRLLLILVLCSDHILASLARGMEWLDAWWDRRFRMSFRILRNATGIPAGERIILNAAETLLVNNPIRALVQRNYEVPLLRK